MDHYTPNEMKKILRLINPKTYQSIKLLPKNIKRTIIPTNILNTVGQLGGSTNTITNSLTEHITRLTDLIAQLTEKFKISEDERTSLNNQLISLKSNMPAKVADTTSCIQQEEETRKFIEQFNLYKENLNNLVNYASNLSILQRKNNDPIIKKKLDEFTTRKIYDNKNYNRLHEEVNKITIEDLTCQSAEKIKNQIRRFTDIQLNENVLSDYEDLSNKTRVFIKLLNRSTFIDSEKQIGSVTFSTKYNRNTKGKLLHYPDLPVKYSCDTPDDKCLSPQSVYANDKYVIKTEYPCSNKINAVPFNYSYGPFFSVFENKSNTEVYNGVNNSSGISTIINQLKRGKDINIFSYGYSGSGKTHTIIGNDKEDGLLQLTIKDLMKMPEVNSMYIEIFELYGQIHPPVDTTGRGTSFKFNTRSDIYNYSEDGTENINGSSIKINLDRDTSKIFNIINKITETRKKNWRIKVSPNNPDSSRGHLFMKVTFKMGENTTKCTFIDSAGIENPISIAQTYLGIDSNEVKNLTLQRTKEIIFDNASSTFWKPEVIKIYREEFPNADSIFSSVMPNGLIKINRSPNNFSLIKKLVLINMRHLIFDNDNKFTEIFETTAYEYVKLDKISEYIYSIITEGFFINETLNHLRVFLLKKSNEPDNIQLISANDFHIGANNTAYSPEKIIYDPLVILTNPENNDPVGLLNILRSINKDLLKAKYIVVGNIRTDLTDSICGGALTTLTFSEQIKST